MDIFVGDLHAKADNLEDTAVIFNLIIKATKDNPIRNVIFLGDIFHGHNAVDLTVADFIKKQFSDLFMFNKNIIVLAGNHDGHSPKSVEINSVELILEQYAKVISRGYEVIDEYVLMPFYGDGSLFIKTANEAYKGNEDKTLVCHQSFIGGVYDNGSPINDGVYPSDIPFKKVINGHIHKKQQISNNIICLGTPRAISANEANDYKAIFLFEKEVFTPIYTSGLVKAYVKAEVHEPDTMDYSGYKINNDDVRIHVYGSKEYYEKTISMAPKSNKIKFIPHLTKEQKEAAISIENEGSLSCALLKYIKESKDIPENIKEKVWERIQQHCQI